MEWLSPLKAGSQAPSWCKRERRARVTRVASGVRRRRVLVGRGREEEEHVRDQMRFPVPES